MGCRSGSNHLLRCYRRLQSASIHIRLSSLIFCFPPSSQISFASVGIGSLLGSLFLLYLGEFLLSRDTDGKIAVWASLGLFLYTVIPALAFFSDILFTLYTTIENYYLFYLMLFTFFLRGCVFFGGLLKRKTYLRSQTRQSFHDILYQCMFMSYYLQYISTIFFLILQVSYSTNPTKGPFCRL